MVHPQRRRREVLGRASAMSRQVTGQHPFERLAKIFVEVESVGYLPGLRSRFPTQRTARRQWGGNNRECEDLVNLFQSNEMEALWQGQGRVHVHLSQILL